MDCEVAQRATRLEEIEISFKSYRLEHPEKKVHFPKDLKRLALLALSEGIPQREIARAAGLTPKAIRNWRNRFTRVTEEQVAMAKNLKLVEHRPEAIVSDISAQQVARIIFKSGVVIEMPPSELSTGLLSRLCELTGSL